MLKLVLRNPGREWETTRSADLTKFYEIPVCTGLKRSTADRSEKWFEKKNGFGIKTRSSYVQKHYDLFNK
jgi:hypothetical protein